MASKKRIDRRYIEHFATELRRFSDALYDGNDTRAAAALGISQAHFSHLVSAKSQGPGSRGPGLSVLLLMRQRTGRSIDELLGLPPPSADELMERLRASFELEIARFRADAKRDLEAARVERAVVQERERSPRPKGRRRGAA